ncbi:hypothetical protein EDD15DRAFT_2212164 [Pisolithus albus]|nr:hypothetical protein EDD15DRAFT_2212164 [Pisolithus albus]
MTEMQSSPHHHVSHMHLTILLQLDHIARVKVVPSAATMYTLGAICSQFDPGTLAVSFPYALTHVIDAIASFLYAVYHGLKNVLLAGFIAEIAVNITRAVQITEFEGQSCSGLDAPCRLRKRGQQRSSLRQLLQTWQYRIREAGHTDYSQQWGENAYAILTRAKRLVALELHRDDTEMRFLANGLEVTTNCRINALVLVTLHFVLIWVL